MTESRRAEIEDILRDLPEIDPPEGMVDEVMSRIRPKRLVWYQKILVFFSAPREISIKPLPIFGALAAACVIFWIGMEAGMHSAGTVESSQTDKLFGMTLEEPESNFFVGRGLMAAGLAERALPLFQKAAVSSPDNPEYAYWEGLCYWANGKTAQERQSYIRGLGSSPEAVPLLLNLGHNYLADKRYGPALVYYDKVLEVEPDERAALYNRGLIFRLQEEEEKEKAAWKSYLHKFRKGKESLRALHRLHDLDDFSYRAYQLGRKKIIFSQEALLQPNDDRQSRTEMIHLANSIQSDPQLITDFVVFYADNRPAAKERALNLKKRLLEKLGPGDSRRIRLSWFGEGERLNKNGRVHQLTESLLIFGRYNITGKTETEI